MCIDVGRGRPQRLLPVGLVVRLEFHRGCPAFTGKIAGSNPAREDTFTTSPTTPTPPFHQNPLSSLFHQNIPHTKCPLLNILRPSNSRTSQQHRFPDFSPHTSIVPPSFSIFPVVPSSPHSSSMPSHSALRTPHSTPQASAMELEPAHHNFYQQPL